MRKYEFSSILKTEFAAFTDLRRTQGYADSCKYVLEWLDAYLVKNNAAEKPLTPQVMDAWIAGAFGGRSVKTRNNSISYLNTFTKYAQLLGIEIFVPERAPKKFSYVPYIFSANEMEAIFFAADNCKLSKYELSQIQFPMLLRLLYGCGLRLGEALSLRHSDIDISNGIIRVNKGKNRKDRLVPMDKSLTEILQKYLAHMADILPNKTFLFTGHRAYLKGKPYNSEQHRTGGWALDIFRITLANAHIELLNVPQGVRNICIHCLRHTFAVNSFRAQELAGIDSRGNEPILSIYMGHDDILATEMYLHMTAESSLDIIQATNEYSKEMFPGVPEIKTRKREKGGRHKSKPSPLLNGIVTAQVAAGMFPEVPK